jgi:hypothetical protein
MQPKYCPARNNQNQYNWSHKLNNGGDSLYE